MYGPEGLPFPCRVAAPMTEGRRTSLSHKRFPWPKWSTGYDDLSPRSGSRHVCMLSRCLYRSIVLPYLPRIIIVQTMLSSAGLRALAVCLDLGMTTELPTQHLTQLTFSIILVAHHRTDLRLPG